MGDDLEKKSEPVKVDWENPPNVICIEYYKDNTFVFCDWQGVEHQESTFKNMKLLNLFLLKLPNVSVDRNHYILSNPKTGGRYSTKEGRTKYILTYELK